MSTPRIYRPDEIKQIVDQLGYPVSGVVGAAEKRAEIMSAFLRNPNVVVVPSRL